MLVRSAEAAYHGALRATSRGPRLNLGASSVNNQEVTVADQLTSVRLSQDALDELRLFADANETSLAAEIRKAVDEYRAKLKGSDEFLEKLRNQHETRGELLKSLLAPASATTQSQ
jgi:hypothetical protein